MAIVCGTDFSGEAKRAARAAIGIAGPGGDELVLVHAMELPTIAFLAGDGLVVPPPVPPPNTDALEKELLQKLTVEARALGPKVRPVLSIGAPEIALLEEVRRYGARLLVVGSHGASGAARWLLGSTADRLARSCPVPLLVVRGDANRFVEWSENRHRLKVLVAVDFDEGTETVISTALDLCRGGESDIHFAHSYVIPRAPFAFRDLAHPSTQFNVLEHRVLDELERLASKTPVPTENIHLLHDKPAQALARLAEEEQFDVVVAGTHGRHGVERLFLGSVAVGLLHRAPCPVVIAPLGPQTTRPSVPRPEEPRPEPERTPAP